ncbi:MAG: NAD(P)H-hydrate dehydratase [Steroidobacteraceae bacterium]
MSISTTVYSRGMHRRHQEPGKESASPSGLFSVEVVRALETAAIQAGTPGFALMHRAGVAALQALRARWPAAREILVLCGGGNNGGDGYVLARLARDAGLSPRVLAAVPVDRLTGDAARAAADCAKGGTPIETASVSTLNAADVIVDALLGIGLQDDVRPELGALVHRINEMRVPVLALDMPSGLCADTGEVRGMAVRAALTVTFIARKKGLWLGAGPDYAGEVVLADLDVRASHVDASLHLLDETDLFLGLPPRARDVHKGLFGNILIVGGGEGMPGAVRLAGEAALRAGAGWVTVWASPESALAVAAGCPELMVRGMGTATAPTEVLGVAEVIAIGPGLGRGEWGRASFANTLEVARARQIGLVLDADALNLLAEQPGITLPRLCVMTPHPAEAARLLGKSTADIQRDRYGSLKELANRYAATVVLKGAGTLVSDDTPWICDRGTPAMAAPGMGDVLTGVIAALLGQGLSPVQAARLGVLWHALAGEVAAAGVDRGVLASEVSTALPKVLAP